MLLSPPVIVASIKILVVAAVGLKLAYDVRTASTFDVTVWFIEVWLVAWALSGTAGH